MQLNLLQMLLKELVFVYVTLLMRTKTLFFFL